MLVVSSQSGKAIRLWGAAGLNEAGDGASKIHVPPLVGRN